MGGKEDGTKRFQLSLSVQMDGESRESVEQQLREALLARLAETQPRELGWVIKGEVVEYATPPSGFEVHYLESEGVRMGGPDENVSDGLFVGIPDGMELPRVYLSHGSMGRYWQPLARLPGGSIFWDEDDGWLPLEGNLGRFQ